MLPLSHQFLSGWEAHHALDVNPVPELLRTELRLSHAHYFRLQLFFGEGQEVNFLSNLPSHGRNRAVRSRQKTVGCQSGVCCALGARCMRPTGVTVAAGLAGSSAFSCASISTTLSSVYPIASGRAGVRRWKAPPLPTTPPRVGPVISNPGLRKTGCSARLLLGARSNVDRATPKADEGLNIAPSIARTVRRSMRLLLYSLVWGPKTWELRQKRFFGFGVEGEGYLDRAALYHGEVRVDRGCRNRRRND